MPLFRSFRVSTYATLALACLCLGYAEGDLLPEAPFITGAVIVMIALAYRAEGRWSLSLQSANTVGGVLLALVSGWIVFQFLRAPTGLVEMLPFPANLLPYLGPVLMILVPAKLFRPKHVGDYWAMQGIGLLAVTLGCAMANDLLFGLLMSVYIFSFAWSLVLFHLYREIQPNEQSAARADADEQSRLFYLFRLAGGWSVVVLAVAVFLFLITPRPSERKWELSTLARSRMETGFSDAVDLNRTGHLEHNDEIAFSVDAADADGDPVLDLNPDQRWRATSFNHYDNGRWSHDRDSALSALDKVKTASGPKKLPDWPKASYLAFTLARATLGANILADPVIWRADDVSPISAARGSVTQHADGEFEWLTFGGAGKPIYTQIVVPLPEPNLGQPMKVLTSYQDLLTRIINPATEERMRRWTVGVLRRLAGEGRLDPDVVAKLERQPPVAPPEDHEKIASALEAFLSSSGEYVYSMDLTRKDKTIDPVEDFLYNTHSGHCERFASALVLMLRSVKIPAQLVVGFRGCEAQGDGRYTVRQSQAHAWAEVFIQRSPPTYVLPPIPDNRNVPCEIVQRLSLDPTPTGEPVSATDEGFGSWLENRRAWANSVFKNLILAYDSDSRQRAAESAADAAVAVFAWISGAPFAFGGLLASLIALIVGWRLRRRRRRARNDERAAQECETMAPFHARLVALLALHGYPPRGGQTTQEFVNTVAAELRTSAFTRDAADVPRQLGNAYYRVRFGGQTLEEEERQSLEAALQRLERALQLQRL